MQWTIKRKLLGLSSIGMLIALLVGLTGYWGLVQLNTSIDHMTMSDIALRNHMEGDMMHDALRADVLAALLADSDNAHKTTIEDT